LEIKSFNTLKSDILFWLLYIYKSSPLQSPQGEKFPSFGGIKGGLDTGCDKEFSFLNLWT